MIMMSLRRRILGVPFRQTYILYPHTKVARAAPPFFKPSFAPEPDPPALAPEDEKRLQRHTGTGPPKKKREISWDST